MSSLPHSPPDHQLHPAASTRRDRKNPAALRAVGELFACTTARRPRPRTGAGPWRDPLRQRPAVRRRTCSQRAGLDRRLSAPTPSHHSPAPTLARSVRGDFASRGPTDARVGVSGPWPQRDGRRPASRRPAPTLKGLSLRLRPRVPRVRATSPIRPRNRLAYQLSAPQPYGRHPFLTRSTSA